MLFSCHICIYTLCVPRHLHQLKDLSSSPQSGANPNCEDDDCRTPLHSAIVKGSRSYECVRLLLDGAAGGGIKANVNHKDR